MQDAPVAVRTAYQFAITNPDALQNVPCYCGCGAIGHKSNLACYIKEFGADGKPVFDDHAMGCSICVDIATDVMKMTGDGKSPAAIRQQIVVTYSKFGTANQGAEGQWQITAVARWACRVSPGYGGGRPESPWHSCC